MGIPSYFRRILQKFPACIKTPRGQVAPDALFFDFNCLIYRCLRSESLPPYSYETHDIWESQLCEEVCKVVKEVWSEAGRPKKVHLAIDGVVPMAKIRQQRVRRFKSSWLSRTIGTTSSTSESWDKNAITPGTKFMDKLVTVLEGFCKRQGSGWTVSGVREPGEGEHKILDALRSFEVAPRSCMIYGLDADLILLSMIIKNQKGIESLYLFREKQEFGGKMTLDAQGKQEYQSLDIGEFMKCVGIRDIGECMRYVGLMNLMGNDFLPHSISYSLGEDGHDAVWKEFRRGTAIVELKDGKWVLNRATLCDIADHWSKDEKDRIEHFIRKKREQALRGPGKGMDASEALPLQWAVESPMMPEGDGTRLREHWEELYWSFCGYTSKEKAVEEYCRGFQWVLDYYTGQTRISKSWMYESWYPPLWKDIAALCKRDVERVEWPVSTPITPEEQLAMVLPLESWQLIHSKDHKKLPLLAPQLWPLQFSFCSFGRLWLWQCEALIPVLTAERVRRILNSTA